MTHSQIMPFSKFNYLITVPDLQPTPARPLHLRLTKITVFPVKSLFSTGYLSAMRRCPTRLDTAVDLISKKKCPV